MLVMFVSGLATTLGVLVCKPFWGSAHAVRGLLVFVIASATRRMAARNVILSGFVIVAAIAFQKPYSLLGFVTSYNFDENKTPLVFVC